MKKLNCWMILISAALVVPVFGSTKPVDLETMDQHIFIGQAYPSGNVYIRRFMDKPEPGAIWPDQVELVPIASNPNLPSIARAQFLHAMESKVENHVVKSVYIPGTEGMDERHDPCGLGEIKKANPSFKTLSGDFFDAILDHCEPNDGIGVFHVKPSIYSFIVIGTDDAFSISNLKIIKKTPRPLSAKERSIVEREKEAAQKTAASFECTTVPAYLDSAVQMFEASVGNELTLRLSTYDNPGCGGHLATIYILDVMKNTEVLKSFTTYQYQGVL